MGRVSEIRAIVRSIVARARRLKQGLDAEADHAAPLGVERARAVVAEKAGVAYKWVDEGAVDVLVRRAAWSALSSALRLAGRSSGPELRWFREAHSSENADFSMAYAVRGFTTTNSSEIYLLAGQTSDEVREAVHHEVAHAVHGMDEAQAYAVGREHRARTRT